ncbi:hypothetical protein E3N88_08932 [Mikania micrantha]|uniref:MULE transposase domain-containing protein n=1 Tax=Mikania micrantha TaxID=192012 RepID=A0A5N6PJY5_9ASTR|nr:hypothetical protein E3N88_08932 [Mikania micrantha]
MGGGDQPLIISDCYLEETEEFLSAVVREPEPDPLNDDIFGILMGDSPLCYIGFDQQGCHSSLVYQTPNGSLYWCPDVSSQFKPVVGKIFLSWDEVYKMHETYGEMSGFGIRVGKPRGKRVDSVNPTSMAGARATCFKVTGCKALIRLRAIKGSSNYVLYEFSGNHNHELISSENMDLTRKGKHLNFENVHFVHAMSLNRVGATVAHRLQASLKGGHHNMRVTRNSYKNVSRDIRMFIGERDVQLVLKKLEERAKNLHNFSAEVYHSEGVLQAIFWANDVSKLSYQLFGDVIAFDATYSTNKYNMIFVPFTGVDHHKKCVTFAAGLIHNETVESYCWLLEAFLKIHVKHPRLVLSDQDHAMRIAMPNVFTQYVHRLCMWHIMKKLPSKVFADLIHNSNIRSRLHKLVWNVYISLATYEEKWHNLMAEFELNNHIWLNEMFSIRELWVPSYFREIPMFCLMKTTSRCESSNLMFKVTSGSTNTLVQFLMCFDTAIDNQRVVEFKSNTTTCLFKTGLDLEVHSAKIYTQTIFKDVQKEIYKGMMNCFINNFDVVDNFKVYTISHMDNRCDFVNQFKVIYTDLLWYSINLKIEEFSKTHILNNFSLFWFQAMQSFTKLFW